MGFKETILDWADKVSDTVDKGVKTGTDGYKKMTEKSKLKKEMTQLGTEVNNILISVGRRVYNEDPSNEKFAEVFAQVREKEAEIERIKAEIQMLEDSTSCKSCGEMIPKTAAVCPKCGAATAGTSDSAKAAPRPEEAQNTCPNCGAEYDAEAKFCSNCGGKL